MRRIWMGEREGCGVGGDDGGCIDEKRLVVVVGVEAMGFILGTEIEADGCQPFSLRFSKMPARACDVYHIQDRDPSW